MKLGDILAITSEHVNVSVIDCSTGEIITSYDGKNSIDAKLNEKEIVRQYVEVVNPAGNLWMGHLCIEIVNE